MSVEIFSKREHVLKKSMWTGHKTKCTNTELFGIFGKELKKITNDHSPTLFKIFDEIIVNATDHECEQRNKEKPVKNIKIKFQDNIFYCYNDGSGIPIKRHESDDRYIPEIIFSECLSGTNMTKSKNSVKGGTNGIGAKAANIHSIWFKINLQCNNKKYSQLFENQMEVIHDPKITKKIKNDYTEITFLPDYEYLGYSLNNQEIAEITAWIKWRTYLVASYCNIKVCFNEERVPNGGSGFLSKMLYPNKSYFSAIIKNEEMPLYPWDCTVILDQEEDINKFSGFLSFSIVNGIIVNKGTHINYLKRTILTAINNKMKDKIKTLNCAIVAICTIPNANWKGQTKEELEMKISVLNKWIWPTRSLKEICLNIANRFNAKAVKTKKIQIEKYTQAEYVGKKKCYLLAAEGDSAIALLRTGLTCNIKGSPTFKNYGIISLQGVILNVRKNYKIINEKKIPNKKVLSNKSIQSLVQAIGLDYNKNYSEEKSLNSLNYQNVIACVDQDVDGCGKILSLLLTFFQTFWPNLIKHGFLQKFQTPVLRAFKNKRVLREFAYERQAIEWMKTESHITYKYYKGLASHTREDVINMFGNFDSSIYTFISDETTDNMIEEYFGISSIPRKHILSKDTREFEDAEIAKMEKYKIIYIKDQLEVDTKLYKFSAVCRQLPNVIDGLTQSRRKILMGAMNYLHGETKVFQFAAEVAKNMAYHHGDSAINKTITCMAQDFPNSNFFPLLKGHGQFGSRNLNGHDAGSARYISVSMNKIVNYLFPYEDKWSLKYVIEDGQQVEPENFIPILPYAILENRHQPSEAYIYECWGRNIYEVAQMVKDMINRKKPNSTLSINNSTDCEFIEEDGKKYCIGKYEVISTNPVIYKVCELPMGIAVENWIKSISSKDVLKTINHSLDKVCVYVHMVNSYELPKVNEQIKFLKIKMRLHSHLNYTKNGKVVSFKKYSSIVKEWFPERQNLYKIRLEKIELKLKIEIEYEEEIIRYISENEKLKITELKSEEEMCKKLEQRNFVKYNITPIKNNSYLSIDELKKEVFKNANYDYLINLRCKDLIKSAFVNRLNYIENLYTKLKKTQEYLSEDIPGKSLWLRDIDSLISCISRL